MDLYTLARNDTVICIATRGFKIVQKLILEFWILTCLNTKTKENVINRRIEWSLLHVLVHIIVVWMRFGSILLPCCYNVMISTKRCDAPDREGTLQLQGEHTYYIHSPLLHRVKGVSC